MIPMFLFSGTFFPVSQLPRWLQDVSLHATPLYHGVALWDLTFGHPSPAADLPQAAYLVTLATIGYLLGRVTYRRRLVLYRRRRSPLSRHTSRQSTVGSAARTQHPRLPAAVALSRHWLLRALFYLLSIGVGLNHLVGALAVGGLAIPYTAYVAPGLLASSAMNGALFDSTFNVFFKLKIEKTYDTVLSTPLSVGDIALGELAWCMIAPACTRRASSL